jgi:hypothetical protein
MIDPMSALGQKQTPALQKGVSALRPIATAKADIANRKTTRCGPSDIESLFWIRRQPSAFSAIRTSRPVTRSEKRRTHSRARRPGASLEECHKPLLRRYRSWLSQKWERTVGTLSNGSPPKERGHRPWFVARPGQWLLTVTQTMTSPLQERDNLLLSVSLF